MKTSNSSLNQLIKKILIKNAVPKAILLSVCFTSHLHRNALIFVFLSVNCYLALHAARDILHEDFLYTSRLPDYQQRTCSQYEMRKTAVNLVLLVLLSTLHPGRDGWSLLYLTKPHRNGASFEITLYQENPKHFLTSESATLLANMSTKFRITLMRGTPSHWFGVLEKSF